MNSNFSKATTNLRSTSPSDLWLGSMRHRICSNRSTRSLALTSICKLRSIESQTTYFVVYYEYVFETWTDLIRLSRTDSIGKFKNQPNCFSRLGTFLNSSSFVLNCATFPLKRLSENLWKLNKSRSTAIREVSMMLRYSFHIDAVEHSWMQPCRPNKSLTSQLVDLVCLVQVSASMQDFRSLGNSRAQKFLICSSESELWRCNGELHSPYGVQIGQLPKESKRKQKIATRRTAFSVRWWTKRIEQIEATG